MAKVASHADVLRGLSRVSAPLTSAEPKGKKLRPVTANFQIWEVHFGPWEISRLTPEKIRKVSWKVKSLTHKRSY